MIMEICSNCSYHREIQRCRDKKTPHLESIDYVCVYGISEKDIEYLIMNIGVLPGKFVSPFHSCDKFSTESDLINKKAKELELGLI